MNKSISIYIHWPFCLALCPYCDFNSHVSKSIDHHKWLDSYLTEISYFKDHINDKQIKSIFFGGGTPSLMQPFVVESIIDDIVSRVTCKDDIEITLEANPTSFETDKFKEFYTAGINRVSIGLQSFYDKDLQILGRKHSAKEGIYAIENAAKIFSKYSFDLIYARPDQTLDSWQKELALATELAGDHISLYQLTIEKGTKFFKIHREGELLLPDNDVAADMYEYTNELLHNNEYNRYEISNYAKRGHECVHNLAYWQYHDYLGIGPGAHSRINKHSIMMTHKPSRWLECVSNHGHGIQLEERLSDKDIITELIMMGTRLSQGINVDRLQQLTGSHFDDVLDKDNLDYLVKKGYVFYDKNHIGLTDDGLMLHNRLVPMLINASLG